MKKTHQDAPSPPLDDAALQAHIDAAPALVGLTVEPAYRNNVLAHLRATAKAAQLVLDFPLEDEAEPAPVFRA